MSSISIVISVGNVANCSDCVDTASGMTGVAVANFGPSPPHPRTWRRPRNAQFVLNMWTASHCKRCDHEHSCHARCNTPRCGGASKLSGHASSECAGVRLRILHQTCPQQSGQSMASLRRPTEGFYDTALNEASDVRIRKYCNTGAGEEKERAVCPEGLCVKTMLYAFIAIKTLSSQQAHA